MTDKAKRITRNAANAVVYAALTETEAKLAAEKAKVAQLEDQVKKLRGLGHFLLEMMTEPKEERP